VLGGAAAAGAAVGAGAVGRWLTRQLGTPQASVGFELSDAELAQALDFLDRYPVIDTHAHPGRTFVRDAEHLTWKLRLYAARGSFEDRAVSTLREGRVAAACFSAVSDFPTLDARGGGLTKVRDFDPGEAWAYYQRQLANLRELADRADLALVLAPDDVAVARKAGAVGAILGVEGADFLDDDLGRVAQCFADGVRLVTLVHYFSGGVIGDVMTAPPVHGGLTPFGRDAVREMNRVGIMVDLSHASERTAYDALEASTKPVLITHTDIADGERHHDRFVSAELARAVAGAGGVVGAWPAGIALGSLAEYADRIIELVALLGEDHVCLGTDMDANYKPVLETYAKAPLLVGGLLRRGIGEEALAKVVGGNFLRVFADVLAGAATR
jgi:membrane dipeptidase